MSLVGPSPVVIHVPGSHSRNARCADASPLPHMYSAAPLHFTAQVSSSETKLLVKSRRCTVIASLVLSTWHAHCSRDTDPSCPVVFGLPSSRAWGRTAARAATGKAELDKEFYEVFSRTRRSEIRKSHSSYRLLQLDSSYKTMA